MKNLTKYLYARTSFIRDYKLIIFIVLTIIFTTITFSILTHKLDGELLFAWFRSFASSSLGGILAMIVFCIVFFRVIAPVQQQERSKYLWLSGGIIALSFTLLIWFASALTITILVQPPYEAKNENIWPPVPPIEFPLNTQKSGEKIEAEFQIIDNKHRLYALELKFLFNKDDQAERRHVWQLTGGAGVWQDDPEKSKIPFGSPERLYAGKWLTEKEFQATPLSIRITLNQKEGDTLKQLLQKDINTHEIGLSSWGASLNKQLLVLPLSIGHYKLKVEVLDTSPKLTGTSINFSITYPHGGK